MNIITSIYEDGNIYLDLLSSYSPRKEGCLWNNSTTAGPKEANTA